MKLSSKVGKNATNTSTDVMMVQAAMSTIQGKGFKKYYNGRIDGRCGPKTQQAIDIFAIENRMAGNNALANGTPAFEKLVDLAGRSTKAQATGVKPHLSFNGSKLCWIGKPFNGKCWSGVSGAKGYQLPKHQNIKNKGPLPEGVWRVRQTLHQSINDIPVLNRLGGLISPIAEAIGAGKIGGWPGDVVAWGSNRIWLRPKIVEKLFGRDPASFAIHGGWSEGSAGCIDLTSQMSGFAENFRVYGADMDLIVTYGDSHSIKE